MKSLAASLLLLATVGGLGVCPARGTAADPQPHAPKVLPATPVKPGPHVDRIKALGDNEWLNLGSPAADPAWGKARGRSWSTNQPAAPNLRGGFVFGEGVHAYVKPNGYYMNDLWFYDINAHRWLCLYPGINTKAIVQQIKDRELTVDEHGLLVDRDGQPVPPLLIHAYGHLGYDPGRKQLAIVAGQFENYFTTGERGVFAEAYRLFEEQRKGKKHPSLSPFLYDTASERWECHPVETKPHGGQPWGGSQLVYVGSRKQFFWGGTSGAWFLDSAKRTWVNAKPQGDLPAGIDHCACYDHRRDRIYYYTSDGKQAEENFYIYDVKQNAWSRPETTGAGPLYASSYESVFSYDTANDLLVIVRLYSNNKEPRRGVYVYDPKTSTWADPLPLPEDVVKGMGNGNFGFYDPELNAWFCHFAQDSTDNGTMWVYRYKNSR